MLVLKRGRGQGVELGPIPGVGMIRVFVSDVSAMGRIDLAIDAPYAVKIRRCELKPKDPGGVDDARAKAERHFKKT